MDTLHLYAIVKTHTPLPPLVGLDGEAVRLLQLGSFAVLVSSRHQSKGVTHEQAIIHHRIVEAASALCASILPARFAAPLALERLEAGLLERQSKLQAQLLRLEQTCEYTVRATLPVAAQPTPTTGKAYLAMRQKALQTPPEMQNLECEFAALPHLEQRRQSHNQPYRMAFLVQKQHQDAFVQKSNALVSQYAAHFSSLGLYGAFAPYSFAEVF
jgi:Gas vesicle synthesis protein GvpL/GvpF